MSVKSLAAWIAILAPLGAAAAPLSTPSLSPAPHCLEARLSSLQFEEKNGALGVDFCKAEALALPAAARSVLAQVRTLNTNVAAVFEMSAHQLFATPFALRIKKSVRGPLVSFAQNESSERGGRTTRLTMGVYPDWTGDEPLNPGVYTHELGHVIGLLPFNSALPPLYREITSTKLMLEMMADFTAFSVAGAIFSPEAGLPACFQQTVRIITPNLSYAVPVEFFTHENARRRTDQCCLTLERTENHTPRSRDFCADHLKEGQTPASIFATKVFSAAFYEEHNLEVEDHRLGLPLNSFLLDLSQQTGLDMAPRLLHAMREAEQDPPRAYVCEIPKLKRFLQPLSETRHSLTQIFARLELGLPDSAKPVYRKLWNSHGMGIAAQISEIDARHLADALAFGDGSNAFNLLYSDPSGAPPDPRLKKTGCWEAFDADVATPAEPGRLDEERPGCNWVCKLAP